MGLATITAVDTAGVKASFQISGVDDKAKLTTLANALQAYCDADLRTRHYHDQAVEVGTPEHNGVNSQVEMKAVIQYFDNTLSKYHLFELPGPKDTMFEVVPGKGDRVTTVAGNAIVALIETATGGDLAFVKGWPVSRRTEDQA
jgi:hypothetical protein